MENLKVSLIALGATALIAGCAPPPPANEMERRARMAAVAEIAARQCAGAAGGYSAARDLRSDANRNITLARELGATDADLQEARRISQATFENGVAWVGHRDACNQIVSELAWQQG